MSKRIDNDQAIDVVLASEFDAAAPQYLKAGVTKEMYIASRKVSLGLEPLVPSNDSSDQAARGMPNAHQWLISDLESDCQ